MEIWKDIDILEGYEISSFGRIKSKQYDLILKTSVTRGYERIIIKKKNYLIHVLVAKAFLPNPENKPQIDHIDRNKLNNSVDNLRWVTISENNINRVFPLPTATGERNIHILKGWFQVKIKRNKQWIFTKVYRTLEEAVEARNLFYEKNNL